MKKVETNKNHKLANTSVLGNMKQNFVRGIAGVSISLVLFSGCKKEDVLKCSAASPTKDGKETTENAIDFKVTDWYTFTNEHGLQVENEPEEMNGNIEYGSVRNLVLNISSTTDLTVINNCKRLNNLVINISNQNEYLKYIDKLPELECLEINYICGNGNLTEEDFLFITKCPRLKEFKVSGFYNIDASLIDRIPSIEKLTIYQDSFLNIDYSKLNNISELNFSNSSPYNVAIGLTREDYNLLQQKNIQVSFSDITKLMMYESIDSELYQMIQEMDLDESLTDEQKMQKVMSFVINKLEYNKVLAEYITENENIDPYENGYLYNCLNSKKALCGNYTAFVSSLLKRLGIVSKELYSEDHAWNAVLLDGEYYYIDATWLDTQVIKIYPVDPKNSEFLTIDAEYLLENGITEELSWYKELPRNVTDSSHMALNKSIIEESGDIKDKEYEIVIEEERFIVPADIVIGLLCAVGGALKAFYMEKEYLYKNKLYNTFEKEIKNNKKKK